MPGLEDGDLNDRAVLLKAGSYNRYGRLGTVDVPVEIRCRWIENVVTQPKNSSDIIGVTATIYTDVDLDIGSILWKGRLKDFPRDWPKESEGLMEVANFHSLDDCQGKETRRWADLTRFRDALPQVG